MANETTTPATNIKGLVYDCTRRSVIRTEHCWVIEDFPAVKDSTAPRDSLKSPEFLVCPRDDIRCKLELYPNGYSDDYDGWCSVFLNVMSDKQEWAEISYSFAILDQTKTMKLRFVQKYLFQCNSSEIGDGDWILCQDLLDPANKCLSGWNNKQLTIVVEIQYRPATLSMDKAETALALLENYNKFLKNHAQQLTDLTLVTTGGGGGGGGGDEGNNKVEHKVHRLVLAAHSPVFKAMMFLTNENPENTTERVEVEDIESDVVAEMIHFVYTGQIKAEFSTDLEKMKRLLVAADKYQIDPLKQTCEQVIGQELITSDNAIEVMAFARQYSSAMLQASAVKCIAENKETLLDKLTQS